MMRKKLISFLMIVCVLASYIVIPAYAEEAKVEDSALQAYELLSDLGIFQNAADYEAVKSRKVTRAELALYVSKMFGIDYSNPENVFTDVDSTSDMGKAVNSLAYEGILNGYGDGTVRPDEYVSLAELAIVSLRALGYKVFGSWSSAEYVKKANELDLLDGINNTGIVTMGDCTVVLYNVLHTNCVISSDTSEKYKLQETKTPLEAVFGLKYVQGVVTHNAYTSLSGERTSDEDCVGINYELYRTEVQEVKDMLGYSVVAYVTVDEEIIKYCYYDIKKNVTFDMDIQQFVDYNNSYVEYYENNESAKIKRIKLSSDVAIIKNSILVETNYEDAFNISYGTIRFISHKNNNSDEYNVILIDSYDNYTVTSVDVGKKIIYTDKNDENGNRIKFDLEKAAYVDIRMTPYNKSVNENTIEPDDLLCLSVSDDGLVIRGFLCENTITGKIEGLSSNGSDSYAVINGESYKLTSDFITRFNISVGMSGTFTLDAFDRVALYLKEATYSDNIGYIYGLFEDDDENINLRIYGMNKKHVTAPLARKVRFDGVPQTDSRVKTALCTLAGGQLKRQLVVFKLNPQGEINSISTAKASKEECIDGDTLYTQLPAGNYKWYYIMRHFEGKYPLSNNTYYMRVPSSSSDFNDKTLYGCQTFNNVTWFNNDETKYILGLYKFDDDTPYSDVLLVSNTDGTLLTTQTEITVVSSVSIQIGPDEEPAVAVRGYRRGSEVVAYFPMDIYNDDIEEGDIIRFVNNVRGVVSDYEVVYDYSLDKVKWDNSVDPTTDEAKQLKYTNLNVRGSIDPLYKFGYVNTLFIAPYVSGLNSVLQMGATPGVIQDTYQTDTASNSNTRFVVVDSSRRNNKVYMGNFDQMTSFEASGIVSETSKAFVHTRAGWLIAIIIYK